MKLQILASTALAMLVAAPGVGAKSINMNEKKKESAKPGAMGTPVLRGEPRKGRVLQQDNCGQCVSKCVQRGGKTGKECKDLCIACPHMNSNLQGAAIPVPDGAVEAGLHGSSGDTGMCGKPCTFEGFECKTDMKKGNTCTKCMPSGTGTVKDPKWTCVDPNSIDESYASDEESTPMNYLRAN